MIGQAGTGSEKRGGLAVSQHEQEEPSGQIYTSINYWRAERERERRRARKVEIGQQSHRRRPVGAIIFRPE